MTRTARRLLYPAAAALLALPAVATAQDFEGWVKATAALKPNDQTARVREKLADLNPKFRGKEQGLTTTVREGVVRGVTVDSSYLTTIAPFRAFTELEQVDCAGTFETTSELKDLSPLKGTRLKFLHARNTSVADLSPLKGMPLESINLQNTKVKDLTPIKDAPLRAVHLPPWLKSADVMFLETKALTHLAADRLDDNVKGATTSKNLAAILAKSKDTISEVQIIFSAVTDLNFLAGTSVRKVDVRWCSAIPSLEPLRKCEKLEALAIQNVQARPLSLAPLRGKALVELMVPECPGVYDLTPLEGMKTLKHLGLNATSVNDLRPIAKCDRLEGLYIEKLALRSLKPLAGLTKLTRLDMRETVVADRDFTPLAKLPLEVVTTDVDPKTEKPTNPALAKVLKTIPTLKTVNGRPAAEVLK